MRAEKAMRMRQLIDQVRSLFLSKNSSSTESEADEALIAASGLFDSKWYLQEYPDVKRSEMAALTEFLTVGFQAGRSPSPHFDAQAYLANHPDVAAAGLNPLLHYLKHGKAEGRYCSHVVDLEALREWSSKHDSARSLVLYESHDLAMQGAQTSLFEIAAGIARDEEKYDVVLSTGQDGPMAEAYADKGIERLFHGTPPLEQCADHEFHVERLVNFYKAVSPDLLHINTLACILPAIAACRLGIPFVWNIREGGDPLEYFNRLPEALRREGQTALAQSNEVIFVAKATHSQVGLALELPSRTSIVPNGLDAAALRDLVPERERQSIRESLSIAENDVIVLNVGTVCERKGQLDLIKAADLIAPAPGGEVVLVFVGIADNEYSQSLRQSSLMLAREGVRVILVDQTVALAERKKTLAMYRAADIFVLTSRSESYPRVTLEAMAFELPIISTPCAGVTEQLEAEKSAIFYPEGAIEALARELDKLVSDPQMRSGIGRAAHERLSELFPHTEMIRAYAAAYDRVMA